MDTLNQSMLAFVGLLAALGVGTAALMLSRAGFDYMFSRGNPRNRAGAHESLIDVGKGAALVMGAALIAGIIIATFKFG